MKDEMGGTCKLYRKKIWIQNFAWKIHGIRETEM
jgi:hypothetical protein